MVSELEAAAALAIIAAYMKEKTTSPPPPPPPPPSVVGSILLSYLPQQPTTANLVTITATAKYTDNTPAANILLSMKINGVGGIAMITDSSGIGNYATTFSTAGDYQIEVSYGGYIGSSFTLTIGTVPPPPPPPANKSSLWNYCPAYFSPTYKQPGQTKTDWQRVIDSAVQYPRAQIVFVINPMNGDDFTRTDIRDAIPGLKAVGIMVLGYVYLHNGTRLISEVQDRITRMKSVYNVDGIMFDESDFADTQAMHDYVTQVQGIADSLGLYTKYNPGTGLKGAFYAAMSGPDCWSIYEQTAYPTQAQILTNSLTLGQAKRGVVVHHATGLDVNWINNVAGPNLGMFYVQSVPLTTNTYGNLSAFWEQQVQIAANYNYTPPPIVVANNEAALWAVDWGAVPTNQPIQWNSIKTLAVFAYRPNSDGTWQYDGDFKGFGIQNMINTAHANQKKCILSLGGFSAGFATIFGSPSLTATSAQNVANEVIARGYDGIDIDVEGSGNWANWTGFKAWVSTLASLIHNQGRTVNLSLYDKTYPWGDFANICDTFTILLYNGSQANPADPSAGLAPFVSLGLPKNKINFGCRLSYVSPALLDQYLSYVVSNSYNGFFLWHDLQTDTGTGIDAATWTIIKKWSGVP